MALAGATASSHKLGALTLATGKGGQNQGDTKDGGKGGADLERAKKSRKSVVRLVKQQDKQQLVHKLP